MVSCQIGTLRRCLVPNVRRIVEVFPETLVKIYEQMLQAIPKANRVRTSALTMPAVRPLRGGVSGGGPCC
jgi:hypothetical protein